MLGFTWACARATPAVGGQRSLLEYLREATSRSVSEGLLPVRFVITSSGSSGYHCELGAISGLTEAERSLQRSVFEFRRRPIENTSSFNVVLLVPTGIGAEIGGHAGDAGPVAKMLAEISDTLILHPNISAPLSND